MFLISFISVWLLIATGLTIEKQSFSIRYPKDTSYNYDENLPPKILKIGSWEKLKEGKKVAILATGSMVGIVNSGYNFIWVWRWWNKIFIRWWIWKIFN